jgi:hypothetical protein
MFDFFAIKDGSNGAVAKFGRPSVREGAEEEREKSGREEQHLHVETRCGVR